MRSGQVDFGGGNLRWYLNGRLHRTDGPAAIWPNGSHHWYLNGLLHREDGPAIILPSGRVYWYLNGSEYSLDDWCIRVDIDEKTRTFLRLKYA